MTHLSLDFTSARLRHYLFKSKLRSALYGADTDRTPLLDSHLCALGQWLNRELVPALGQLPATQELVRAHDTIHDEARRLLRLYDEGHVAEAQGQLTEVEELGARILALLTQLEQEASALAAAGQATSDGSASTGFSLDSPTPLPAL